MNVLHIISSLKQGGAENLLVQLIEQLQTKGVKSTVIYFHEGPYVHDLQKLGINTLQARGIVFRYDLFFFIRLWRYIKMIKPDCIHSSLWMANLVGRFYARIMRIPHISSIHNNVDQDGFLRNMIDRYTMALSTHVVAVSNGVSQSIGQYHKNKALVIANGINGNRVLRFSQSMMISRAHIGLHEHHFVIGSVGRFVAVKNYPLLIDAFKLLLNHVPHARLVLVGTGQEEYKLKLRVKELGLHPFVHFIIGKPAYSFYPLFDCFCLSSYKEGVSIALLEAMSLNRACVVTNYEKVHDVIQHEINGLVVPSYHPQDLTNTLLQLTNLSLRKSLGEMAQKTVNEQFSIEKMTEGYYQLYMQNSFKKNYVNL